MDTQKSAGINRTDGDADFTGAPNAYRGRFNGFYTLWMALLATAIVAAGFGVSYLAYVRLTSHVPTASVETLGDLWDGGAP